MQSFSIEIYPYSIGMGPSSHPAAVGGGGGSAMYPVKL